MVCGGVSFPFYLLSIRVFCLVFIYNVVLLKLEKIMFYKPEGVLVEFKDTLLNMGEKKKASLVFPRSLRTAWSAVNSGKFRRQRQYLMAEQL